MSKILSTTLLIFRIALVIVIIIIPGFHKSIVITILFNSFWIEGISYPNDLTSFPNRSGFIIFSTNRRIAICGTIGVSIYWLFVLIFSRG